MKHNALICLVLLSAVTLFADKDSKNHNILFITIDDLNDWVEPLGGHPQSKTPHLSKLASEGFTFTNAHCASPSCNPSRTSILTGVHPHRSGVYQNWAHFRNSPVLKDAKTLPQHFREHGYTTVGTGKIFHAPNRMPEKWIGDPDSWDIYFDGHKGSDLSFFMPKKEQLPLAEGGNQKLDWHAITDAEAPPLDEAIVGWTTEQLVHGKLTEPFFFGCGILKPHLPLYAPKKHFDSFPLATVRNPPIQDNDREDIPSFAYGLDPFLNYQYDDKIKANDKQLEAVRAYLACVAYVDDCIGRVTEALKNSPYADNTLIVILSDHGFHLGEKGHWGKFSLWQESTRSLLMLHGPDIPQDQRTPRTVGLIDVYPTLLDYCGHAPKREHDGVSLMPLINDPEIEWNAPVLTTSGRKNHRITTDAWSYISYSNGTEELYHLSQDPNEWKNLAKIPEHAVVKKQLRSFLPNYDAEEFLD